MKRVYNFSTNIRAEIDRIFSQNNWVWNSKRLAEDILQLSDFYIHNPMATTPWDKPWAQRALITYYWPLNSIRFQSVTDELEKVSFFEGLNHAIDFGAGPATASFILKKKFPKIDLIEKSLVPQKWFQDFTWTQKIQTSKTTCAVFCYSMTEMSQLPMWARESEAVIILEPATQQDGRSLLHHRQNLIDNGFSIWAPCSHQDLCPLLTHSKTDWCHDRVQLDAPDWFLEIENYLPIKNKTLTTSYLAARKTPAPKANWARITGDSLPENGKTRQMICRGSNREFLAWMHRNGTPPEFYRGERVILEEFDTKSNELRIKKLRRVESV